MGLSWDSFPQSGATQLQCNKNFDQLVLTSRIRVRLVRWFYLSFLMQQEKSNLFLEPNMAALIRTLDFKSWFVEATDEFADLYCQSCSLLSAEDQQNPSMQSFLLEFSTSDTYARCQTSNPYHNFFSLLWQRAQFKTS